nr:protein breast cancer susceptibility 1 homolog [Tanacetum cinerariifolium]
MENLIRMAEELKCPICLSLLKSAVSLTCNHIFCNVCIEKSMKSDSTCPVCKVPYRPREVRPAPHMDTLVSIYKSMKVSSGVNILVTQTQPQTAGIGLVVLYLAPSGLSNGQSARTMSYIQY